MKRDLTDASRLNLNDFRGDVNSQSGEDGIIAKIFETIGTTNRVCVDVGAFDLVTYSNTRHLWKDQGWRAILIEGNSGACDRMMRAKSGRDNILILNRYVTPQGNTSLDNLLAGLSIPRIFDLLSIDVDGLDYHIWKNLIRFRPRVVVIEFNPTIPPHIVLIGIEQQNYMGPSAKALLHLGIEKGYALVACTALNAVFVLVEESSSFGNINNLDALFDRANINYLMASFDGGLFFSNSHLPFGYNPFSREPREGIGPNPTYYIPSDRLSHYVSLWLRERLRRFKRRLVGSRWTQLARREPGAR